MSVGVLAHLCGKSSYKELAYKVGSHGFRHVQLALWKAISDWDFSRPGKLSPGLAGAIAEEFDKHGVSISVLGCYVHLFDRDEEKRKYNIRRFKELLRYARFFGAPIVAAETGKNPEREYDEKDWVNLKHTLEELVEEAERWGVFIGLEPADEHLIDDARSMRRLLDEMPSSHIGVVMDPGNLITPQNLDDQDRVIEEVFELLGEEIIFCHIKDRMRNGDQEVISVPAGRGQMNYELFFRRLNQYKPHVNMILDAVSEENMAETKGYVEGLLRKTASHRED